MRGLDAHIEGRHGPFTGNNPWSPGPPPGVEDVLDQIIYWPEPSDEPPDCEKCQGKTTGGMVTCRYCDGTGKGPALVELGKITDYDEWSDEDDGGKYGGVDLIVTHTETGDTATIKLSEAEDEYCIPAVPAKPGDVAALKAAKATHAAEAAERKAKDERQRALVAQREAARERAEATEPPKVGRCDRCGKDSELVKDPEGTGCEWCAECATFIADERATRA